MSCKNLRYHELTETRLIASVQELGVLSSQGCFILGITRPEINFRANSPSPLKRIQKLIYSRF